MKTLLTNTFIKSLSFEGKAEYYWDEKVTGLYLRLSKTRKTFYYRYRLQGKTNQFKIGKYDLISLKQARTKAAKLYIKVQNGEDPKGNTLQPSKKKEETGLLFSEALTDYKEYKLSRLKATTVRAYKSVLRNHILPHFGNKDVKRITKGEVTSFLEKKHKEMDGSRIVVNIKTTLSSIFTYFESREWVDKNPVKHAGQNYKKEHKPRQRMYDDKEITSIMGSLNNIVDSFRYVVAFTFYTAKRRNEIMSMEWQHIDLEKQIWTIPEGMTKNSTEDKVYLCDSMCDLLRDLYDPENTYVFPSPYSKKQPRVYNAKWNKKLRDESGVEDFILHDIRRTVSSNLAKMKVSHHVIDLILNNGSSSKYKNIRNTYNKYDYMDEKKEALQLWEAKLEKLIEK